MGTQKLLTAGGGGVQLTPASSIASDVTVQIPSANTTLVGNDTTQTLTNKTINGGALQSGTSVASTSGTSIDFTSIPSWVKRITVMFSGVSTNGSSENIIQVGSGSVTTTGYLGSSSNLSSTATATSNYTTGFGIRETSASRLLSGNVTLTNISSNIWVCSGIIGTSAFANSYTVGGVITLSGALDRIRITTVNGTDTFDAGSINILYE